jgi:hypothetical protein
LGELLKIWPNQPWLNRAAGWELFSKDDLEGALWYLDQAFENDPSTLLPELETLARLRYLHGLPASILAEEFNFWVPGLATLTKRESADRQDYYRLSSKNHPPGQTLPPHSQAYVFLDQGHLDQALALIEPGPVQDRLIRLAGASYNASDELIQRALSLPVNRGLDRDTAWAMFGMALKHGQPTADYEKVISETSPFPADQIVTAIKDKDLDAFQKLILGRDAWLQGQGCLAAEISGLDVPEKCPQKARGFLFVGEKPALLPLPPSPGHDPEQDQPPNFNQSSENDKDFDTTSDPGQDSEIDISVNTN